MRAVSIKEAMADLPGLINTTIKDVEETIIISDFGSVVVIDKDEWESLQETLRLLKDKKSFKALLESHKIRDEGKKMKSKSIKKAFHDLQG